MQLNLYNIYNIGAIALNEGNIAEALSNFEQALEQAVVIGPEADKLKSNCQNAIPKLYLELGKEAANARDFDGALEKINIAIAKAEEFGLAEDAEEGKALIPQVVLVKGNNKLNDGDFAGAIEDYKKVIEFDPENGMAYFRLGQAAIRVNDEATAVDALQKAATLGQEKNANKALSTHYLKQAAAAVKAKKYDEAISAANKSNEVMPNAQAYSICGFSAIAAKKYDEAIAAYESYVAMSPNARDINQTYYQLATAYEAKGDKEKACGYYSQIMSDPTFGEYATYKVKNELKCN
ncbi:MAG: tetratricopeptide repeat protein [Bacteroidales bacterium]|nr:tetratricopeptide repeat protein [Bacteroidales bacterium]